MRAFTHLTLDGVRYSKEWILQHADALQEPAFSRNQINALTFCKQWLEGRKEFPIQTSGSTGTPKNILLRREQMILSAKLTGDALGLTPDEKAFVCLPCTFVGGKMMLVRSFELGLDVTIMEPSGNPFKSFPETSIPCFHFTAFIPMQLQAVLDAGQKAVAWLNRFKAVLVGGAPISHSLSRQIKPLDVPVYQTFGMTETVSHIALRRLNGCDASGYYEVLPHVTIGTDARGCLTIESPLTSHRKIITNDIVEIISGRRFIWKGRFDNVINSGGIKVQAEKVERCLEELLSEVFEIRIPIFEYMIGGVPDELLGEKVVLLFEGRPAETILNEIRIQLSGKLQKYEMPKEFYFLDKFVRTSNGKIDRIKTLRLLKKSNLNKSSC